VIYRKQDNPRQVFAFMLSYTYAKRSNYLLLLSEFWKKPIACCV